MKIAIGSENPVKVSAVKKAFGSRLKKEKLVYHSKKVDSGVAAQPYNDEIRKGALNRAKLVRDMFDSDYGVGLEGGIEIRDGLPFEYAWCAIVNKEGLESFGHSFGILMPQVLMKKIQAGMELGDALDDLLQTKDLKKREGFFGLATGNLVTREHGYMDMILAALAPITLPQYYK